MLTSRRYAQTGCKRPFCYTFLTVYVTGSDWTRREIPDGGKPSDEGLGYEEIVYGTHGGVHRG